MIPYERDENVYTKFHTLKGYFVLYVEQLKISLCCDRVLILWAIQENAMCCEESFGKNVSYACLIQTYTPFVRIATAR